MFLISACTILIIFTFLQGKSNQRKMITPDGETRLVTTKGVLITFALILIVTSTLRYGFIDTYAYKIMYRESRNNLEYVNSAPWGVEAGWLYLLYYLNYITSSPKIMLFLVALVVNMAYILMAKKYSSDVLFSAFVYFCIGYMDTNNGVRQCFATGITMLAFPLLIEKKYIPYSILVAIASIFHESAIFLLLIAFVADGKPFNIKVILALIACFIFWLNPSLVSGMLQEAIIDNKYSYYLSQNVGMSFLRCFIIAIIPLFLAIMHCVMKKPSKTKTAKTEGLLINMIVINSALYLMGLYMQYWARLAFYTSFAPIVMLPKLIKSVFKEEDAKWIKSLALILYFIFFAYNIYVNIFYGAIRDFRIEWW